MELGAIISQKRKQAGLTIDELAERSGVPKGTLNKDNQWLHTRSANWNSKIYCTRIGLHAGRFWRFTPRAYLVNRWIWFNSAVSTVRFSSQEVVRFLLTKELERLQNLGAWFQHHEQPYHKTERNVSHLLGNNAMRYTCVQTLFLVGHRRQFPFLNDFLFLTLYRNGTVISVGRKMSDWNCKRR